MKRFTITGGYFLWLLLLALAVNAQESPVWLSNVPPGRLRKEVSTYGMHRLCTMKRHRGRGGPIRVIQWVRRGISVEHAAYLSLPDSLDKQTFVFSPKNKRVKSKILNIKGKSVVEYVDNAEGYWNVYLVIKQLSGDTLYVNIAKAELLSHSCRNGHPNVRKAVLPRIFPEKIPFEIVRERHINENFHFFIASGDKFTYKPMYQGKPVAGIPIVLSTEKGWVNRKMTNRKGEATFQFIQDYFSKWSEIRGRKIYSYMIFSEFTKEQTGTFRGKNYRYVHYVTSMSDGYFPSRTMYQSMVWGLIIFIISLVIISIGVFVYRERRKKPYKEYIFDENENK
ncbi:hypothetical protein LA303_10145 [Candidatus Sulfidibacterium hydrothermale]|uniref:hypothetical protein n=1 Tax=Candidatus Sulfidibacterium hydrothermale TaxID=2875962 RepID=UPI001F0ABE4D|nr:hypothetical protein [Candidatus Sulfidibacterium hydrothermale]UBM61764.1 hypothetical protein LA303_10145 [Candidatus Sulfidibacterium hydrothermale]